MSTNLMHANRQWATRPADQRFKNVAELHAAVQGYKIEAREAVVQNSALRVEAVDGDVKLIGATGQRAELNHWSFGQLSQRANAPAAYLRELPATLAVQNLNHGLKARDANGEANVLFRQNGETLEARALTSGRYTRIWNSDVTERLMRLQDQNPNWTNPLAYKVIETGKNGGWPQFSDELVPSGLYASDHDMFAFLVDESKTIDGSPSGLNRGFFVWNSEVGASAFGVMTFLYDRVCGNNIVWGATNVMRVKIRHVGNADERAFTKLAVELKAYSESSSSDLEASIQRARNYVLGASKADVLDAVFGLASKNKTPELSKTLISEAYDTAVRREDRYGNPNSLWAMVGGLTENSQGRSYADERVKIDTAAGKLLKTIEF